MLMLLITMPSIFAPYLLGYEIGVFFLPIAHDWVHLKTVGKMKYILYPLEKLGFIANKKDHHRHHNYSNETVYQSFSSSGLYLHKLDNVFDKLWNFAFLTSKDGIKPAVKLWNIYTTIIPLVISTLIFILFNADQMLA